MKVLVTGSSGLLASNTIVQLLENGFEVRALIRNKNKIIVPGNDKLEIIEGSITDSSIIKEVVKGCDAIVHAAAETRQGLIDFDEYCKINVDATKMICSLAVKAGVQKLLYISTANVFGFGTNQNPGDENTSIKAPFINSLYVKSKELGQKIAFSYSNKMDVVAINPSFIIGPYDQKPGSGRIIRMGYNKRIIFYPPGGKNFVNATDVANSIVSAIQKGKNGESYLLANENLSYYEFFKRLSEYSNTKPILIKIPRLLWLAIGYLGDLLKFIHIKNEITSTNMQILCVNNFYSNKKAVKELGVQFNPVDNAIQKAILWINGEF